MNYIKTINGVELVINKEESINKLKQPEDRIGDRIGDGIGDGINDRIGQRIGA